MRFLSVEVPCGPADDPFPCAFDELCVTHQTNCIPSSALDLFDLHLLHPGSKETDEEAADKEKAKNCTSAYSCEWRREIERDCRVQNCARSACAVAYWDLDLNLFSARCTEYYTLQKNQTCGDAMAKFFLPWKVFAGFNPEIDCKKAEEGDKVCVHAYVEPRSTPIPFAATQQITAAILEPVCGKQRCKLGEKCIHTECAWKPRKICSSM